MSQCGWLPQAAGINKDLWLSSNYHTFPTSLTLYFRTILILYCSLEFLFSFCLHKERDRFFSFTYYRILILRTYKTLQASLLKTTKNREKIILTLKTSISKQAKVIYHVMEILVYLERVVSSLAY